MVKFSDEVCSIILDARASGMTKEECAGLAGIAVRTLDFWLEKGRAAKSGKYRDFYFEYLKANLEFKKYHRDKIAEHKDWHASQYLLQVNEHGKYDWAHHVKSKVESKVEAEVKAEVKLSDLFDDEELDKILEEDDNDDNDLYDIE